MVKQDVLEVVREFFYLGTIIKQFNFTILCLIPKKDGIIGVDEMRPTTCWTVILKVIYKILATRLSIILDRIVIKNQSGFVKGMCIVDNILTTYEIVNNYNIDKKDACCVLKVDLRKCL